MSSYSKQYYQEKQKSSLQSAQEVVPLVLELIQPLNVIDIGCGIGIWLSVFKEHGVEEVWGIDGEWVDEDMLHIPREQFMSVDLSKTFIIGRQFDLVVSLEVAEHLPFECSETFVDSLTHLGPVILFSAALPLQGGVDHLNEQWPDYWAKHFFNRGYLAIDCLRKKIWQNENVECWYTQNIFFYVKKDYLKNNSLLQKEYEYQTLYSLSIVHPRHYLKQMVELNDWKVGLQKQVAELNDWGIGLQKQVAELEELKPGRVSLKKVLFALPSLTMHAIYTKIDRIFSRNNS